MEFHESNDHLLGDGHSSVAILDTVIPKLKLPIRD